MARCCSGTQPWSLNLSGVQLISPCPEATIFDQSHVPSPALSTGPAHYVAPSRPSDKFRPLESVLPRLPSFITNGKKTCIHCCKHTPIAPDYVPFQLFSIFRGTPSPANKYINPVELYFFPLVYISDITSVTLGRLITCRLCLGSDLAGLTRNSI